MDVVSLEIQDELLYFIPKPQKVLYADYLVLVAESGRKLKGKVKKETKRQLTWNHKA